MRSRERNITEFDLQLDSFMLHCDAKYLSPKILKSFEQTVTLFGNYLKQELKIEDAAKVKSSHIRQYIKYLRNRGKYTVSASEKALEINYPNRREDYQKPMSDVTIANYTRNMKIFFNFLKMEREIVGNSVSTVEKIKLKRKQKQLLSPEEIKLVLRTYNLTKFHEYRTWTQLRLIIDTGFRATDVLRSKMASPKH
ncbi:hypothetical protein JFL43_04055 [Viridibacillus sp. YIM B01967]|uniref:Core-binding (CB) domain-containing protein n=1 Tax=Viridibacillus soli TaxID=2798301 RepID=A0ABS1H424_9BACL|nr:hypothetical protein [Viridibacillus soli]MBK3494046.1 hypothetical protein [Viridibacillus soli]